jgi:DNA-binding XRE family transcriptional regulator
MKKKAPTRAPLTPEERRIIRQRAVEFRRFRRDFLYTQAALAESIRCAKRTIADIELGKTINPNAGLLKRFRDLKQKEALKQHRWETEMAS